MVRIDTIDTNRRSDVIRFYRVPFPIYEGCAQWVPPLWADLSIQLNRKKHPFYEHSDADFFIAVKDGRDAGRIAVMENKPYNEYHKKKLMSFYLFESIDDDEVADALFEKAFAWGRARGLNGMLGPTGFGPIDGYGMLIEGFEHRQTMMMMAYNHAYYPRFMERLGFRKEVDFITCLIHRRGFRISDRIRKIAKYALDRGQFELIRFKNQKELLAWVPPFIEAYKKAFYQNWEFYPLTDREVTFVVDNIMQLIDPNLIRIITHKGVLVGFVLAFPDVSDALQRTRGYVPPFSFLDPLPSPRALVDIILTARKATWVALNGAGILPEYKGRGGNAILYLAMEESIDAHLDQIEYGELCQVAETTAEMRSDLINLGGKPYKNHRVFIRSI
jgi:hypothetical protein